MTIYINGLDIDYKDCVIEMGGIIDDDVGTINVTLVDVNLFTDGDTVSFTSPTVGMVLSRHEYGNIEIV